MDMKKKLQLREGWMIKMLTITEVKTPEAAIHTVGWQATGTCLKRRVTYYLHSKEPPTTRDLRGSNFKISATIHQDCASIRLRAEKPLRQGFWSHRPQHKAGILYVGDIALDVFLCISQDITSRGPTRKRFRHQARQPGPAPSQTTKQQEKKKAPEKERQNAEEWA